MKNTIKIYVVTVLCTAFAVPAYLVGAAAPQKLEEFQRYSELPSEIQQNVIAHAAQPLINYIRDHYSFTLEHTLVGSANNAQFSPDGTLIVTATYGAAKIWDTQGNLRHILAANRESDTIINAQFSPDGTLIVTASDDGTAKIWNIQGNLLHTLAGPNRHTRMLNNAQFNPDSNLIVTASYDGTAKIWDIQGNLLHTLDEQNRGILCVKNAQFSPDGTLIVTASNDGTAKIWDTQGNLLHTLAGHTRAVFDAQFNPDSNLIVTASNDDTAKIWDIQGNLLHTLAGHTGAVTSAQFSPDGTLIVTVSKSNDSTAKIWDIQGNLLHTLVGADGRTSHLNNAQFSPDGNLIVTASSGIAKIWDIQGNLLHTLRVEKNYPWPVENAQFSPDGTLIVTASSAHGATKIWGPQQTEPFINWIKNKATLNQISYLSSALNVPDAVKHNFNNDQIRLLFFNEQKTGFAQTMDDEQFNFLTTVLNITPPAGIDINVLQTNLLQRKDILEKLVTYLQTNANFAQIINTQVMQQSAPTLLDFDQIKPLFIEWLQKHATVHQLAYIANKLHVPNVPIHKFSEKEIPLLWANPQKNTGFKLEMNPTLYKFLNEILPPNPELPPDIHQAIIEQSPLINYIRANYIVAPLRTEQFINWIKKDATFNQISYLASALNVPGAAPHTFNADQIRFLFANGQNSGFRQTMNDEQFNFLTTVLNIQPPAGVTPDVLQTNLQHRKDVLEKLVYYLRDIKKQQTNLWSLSKAKEPFIEWLQKHATSHQLTYIANQLGVPGVPPRAFSDAEISLLWANPRRNTGFALEMNPDVYNFLTDELGIKNPTSQTPESEIEQSSVEQEVD